MMIKSVLLLLVCFVTTFAHADQIEFPEEELARETVLPVFEKRRAVLNRNIETAKHFEFGVGGGLEMNEPYFNDYMGSLTATYNFDDTNAFNVEGLMWMDGLSSYGEQLKTQGVKVTGTNTYHYFDASYAPHPKWAVMGNYEFIAYYGKISITKQTVMNLNLFGLVGLGYLNLGTQNTVAVNVGVGQNFFFTQHFGLRADLRMLMFQGPNPASPGNVNDTHPPSFENRFFFNSQIGLSAIAIL